MNHFPNQPVIVEQRRLVKYLFSVHFNETVRSGGFDRHFVLFCSVGKSSMSFTNSEYLKIKFYMWVCM